LVLGAKARRLGDDAVMSAQLRPQSIRVNDTELTYVEQGRGEPVLVVHGTLGDFRSWFERLTPLAERYRVIAYSRRAHYPNAWPADHARCLPSVHAADMAMLIEGLKLGPTLVLASQRPALVRTLILGEPPLLSLLDATSEGRAIVAGIVADEREPARLAFADGDLEAGVRVFLDSVIGEGTFAQLPGVERDRTLDNAAALRAELETPPETFFSTLTCADLQRIDAPALLLSGELSPTVFPRVTGELARCLLRVEQAMIPGVSHDLWNPPVFTNTVLGFLAAH
jgi:non-heme chloroperoxidase